MPILRRDVGLAVAVVLTTAFAGGPAAAQTSTPEVFLGSAAGRALALSVGSTQVTFGAGTAEVDSTLEAAASGTGALGVPVVGGTNAGEVSVSGDGTSEDTGEKCAGVVFPAPLSTFLTAKAACSSARAEVTGGLPKATGSGRLGLVDVNAQSVLNTPISAVQGAVNALFGTLDGITDLTGVELNTDNTVGQLLTALGTTKTLEAELGTSRSTAVTENGKVTAATVSEGGVVRILPVGAAGLKPVVEIVAGSASASAVYDRAKGTSAPSFDPAVVTIKLNSPTTDSLGKIIGQDLTVIELGPELDLPVVGALASPCADGPNEYCLLPGTPFETRVAVASGRADTTPDGTATAVADAVEIHALKNIGTLAAPLAGGIRLELAHAEAAVGGTPATVVRVSPEQTPERERGQAGELPRTGGAPLLPLFGGAALGLALGGRRLLARGR